NVTAVVAVTSPLLNDAVSVDGTLVALTGALSVTVAWPLALVVAEPEERTPAVVVKPIDWPDCAVPPLFSVAVKVVVDEPSAGTVEEAALSVSVYVVTSTLTPTTLVVPLVSVTLVWKAYVVSEDGFGVDVNVTLNVLDAPPEQ